MEDNEKGIFLEVDKDLRRAGARKSAYLPVCSRGAKCARKNTQHFREYRHSVELNSVVSLTKFIAGSKKARERKKKKTSNCKLQINAEKSAAKRPALKCQLPITFGDPDTDGYFKPEKNASTSTFSNAQGKDLHCSGEPKRGNNVENEEAGQKSKCRRRKTIHKNGHSTGAQTRLKLIPLVFI
ncbi:hypothetical protein TYRP_005974 [Tyrophagus putrescentiae]|nr:hypothetical protein TYRP_005974 [Tyrophagus putrescentiae]